MQIDPHLRESGFTFDIPICARPLPAAEQSKILGETAARFTV
jgi:hypothetical protein